jgi:O-antigen ligase
MRLLQPASRSQRIFLILIIASLAVSMLLSRNRGQWIALTTGLFFAYTGYMNKLKIRWFVIAGALIGIIFSGMIIERFSELEEENQWGHSKNTFENRQENWKTAVSIVPNHFFTGHGIGTSKMVWEKEFGREHVPHNDYLRLVLETGIFGLSFYLLFLFTVLVKNVMLISDKTNWFINYPSLALIIYWMLHSAFQNIIYNVIVFPIFMALVALAAKWNICLSREPVCESETSEQPLTLSSYATDKPI